MTTVAPHDPEIADLRLGPGDMVAALGGAIEYHANGGKCKRQRCTEDAPWVKLGKRKLKLPCSQHADEERVALEAEEREAQAALYLAESGATDRLRPWSFETYRRDCGDAEGLAALAVAERWVKTYLDTGAGRNMLMWGPVGCGKTGLAWAIVRDLCEHGKQARLVNFAALLEAIKDCYGRKVPTTHAMECHRVKVLVLDDLGAERPTEWACGELLGIVDHRYERGLPTIYISNYAPGLLAKRLGRDDEVVGARILSRMSESATKFEFKGSDRRVAA